MTTNTTTRTAAAPKQALLLMDPHSNRFEIIHDSKCEQNPLFQSYQGVWGSSAVRVAVPHGMSLSVCIRRARSILTTDPVHSMLIAKGFDLQDWHALPSELLILCMDLSSKRFELVLTDESLQQIPLRDASLKQQVYVGLCDVYPNVRVAIPQHKTAEECVALARSILNTKQVMRTLHFHGFHIPPLVDAVILLLDPNKTHRLECLRLDGLSLATTTVTHVLDYVRKTAREPVLRQQSYTALFNAAGHVATTSLHVLGMSRTWVALPKGVSIRKCRAMARSVYSHVQKMLQQNGFNVDEWCSPSTTTSSR